MTTSSAPSSGPSSSPLRVSDADREAVADRLRQAAADGRLTLDESDERQQLAYAARTRDDLVPLTADLPAPEPARSGDRAGPLTEQARRRLTVHAAVAAVLAVLLVFRWAAGMGWWFWPVWPLFWIGVSLAVHYFLAERAPKAAT
ncbi:DUF1707 SHOCT-like domain-containing protein [Pseudonocardia nigra]|uniref:DUF1707 SHOCT-like domain-containing protein n=1 Tax=Pseudonocardia nigra TaxID=1921578 RepID=UPI001C5F1CEE|nr:DUF1707 domain-containing protein [Pseudonocardia nigra]